MSRIFASISSLTKQQQLIGVLFLFFLSEALTRITFFYGASFHNYSALAKGFFMLVAVVYAGLNLTSFRKRILLFMCSIMLIFCIGQLSFNDFSWGANFKGNLAFVGRYLFVFSICLLYNKEFTPTTKKKLYTSYEVIVLINSALIILGALFDIQLFKTYYNRFGYNGVFMAPSISTFFYALALTYFTFKYLTQKKKLWQLLVVCVVCILVGTKALLLFLILTTIHVFLYKKMYRNKWFYSIGAAVVIAALLCKEYITNVLSSLFSVPLRVYNDHGLITSLTSYRNWRLRDNFLPVIEEKWGVFNYFFGGTDFITYRVEFEVFDVFLFFGLIGTALYLLYYFTYIIGVKQLSTFGVVQICFLLFIALLSGTFFNNAPVAFYLLIVLGSLKDKLK